MTHRHRDELVEARAHLILADELAAAAYADHFEAQMRPGKVRKLLSRLRVLRRTGKVLLAILSFLFDARGWSETVIVGGDVVKCDGKLTGNPRRQDALLDYCAVLTSTPLPDPWLPRARQLPQPPTCDLRVSVGRVTAVQRPLPDTESANMHLPGKTRIW